MLAFGAAVAQEHAPPGQQRRDATGTPFGDGGTPPRHLRRRRRDAPRHIRRRDAAATPANTPNFSSRHRYARGLKTTVRILPPLRGSVMIIVLSVGYASLTHGWGPVAPTGLKSGVLASRRWGA